MKHSGHWLPWAVVALTIVSLLGIAWPHSDRQADWHYREFGRLPVVQEGRIMPLDTVARLALMSISHRQTLYYGVVDPITEREKDKRSYSASKWLLDCLASPEQDARFYLPAFNVASAPLRQRLGLEPREGNMYSVHDLTPGLKQLINADQKPDPQTRELLTELQQYIKHESDNLPIYDYRIFRIENDQVLHLLGFKERDGLRYSFRDILTHGKELEEEARRVRDIKPSDRNLFDNKVAELYQHVQTLMQLTAWRGPLAIPPGDGGEVWSSLLDQLEASKLRGRLPLSSQISYTELLAAYHLGSKDPLKDEKPDPAQVERFNKVLAGYHEELDKEMPSVMRQVRLEAWFNEFAPFYYCSIIYALVAIIGCLSWLVSFRTLNRTALGMMIVVFAVHTMALVCRMYIQGRPPVTNLYSSAIFIGWGCVLTCLVVEVLCRYSIALIVGSVTGALSLVVAHFLSLDGDTLGMLQAVLDTNFWLATHVVCITLGYTATFVAGFMGVAYILLGVLSPLLSRDISEIFPTEAGVTRSGKLGIMLHKMTYGVVCFAMLLSFTGTVLGGIWADQSWGRFWGWDPKENGALLIVIWNALILHARWGGMVKQRGLAVLAVFGNIITAWSWFGTNLLGIGLHAYGFIKGAMLGMVLFDVAHLAVIGLGLLPLTMWGSFRPSRPPKAPTPNRELANVS